MKRIKAITSVLMVILVVFGSTYTAFAAVYVEDWGFRFEKADNGASYEINKYIGEDTDVTIPDSYNGFKISSVGEYAFLDTSITSVTMGKNITEVENCAFLNVTSLTSVVLDDGLTSIGNLAFAGCTSLESITIPNNVVQIDSTAFNNDDNLVIWCYRGSYAESYAQENGINYQQIDPELLPGDADGNGTVNINDVTAIQKFKLGKTELSYYGSLCADVNGDGDITIRDATLIQMKIAGMTVDF